MLPDLGEVMPILEFLTPEHVASFLTLTFLEIVLAGDNLVLIAILAGKLPERQRALARRIGVVVAVLTRLLLLFSLFWLAHLETPIAIPLPDGPPLIVTARQIVLGLGGVFLIWKSLSEISAIFGERNTTIDPSTVRPWRHAFMWTILQIAIFDLVFSLDSVIAAIGLAQHVEVMAAAVITAAFTMFFLVNPISNFIDRHQVVKLVALNFLTLIGSLLVAEAAGLAVPRAYFYMALGVAIAVQVLILWLRSLPPRAWQALTLMLMILGLAVVVGATLLVNDGYLSDGRTIAILVAIVQGSAELLMAAFNWARSWLSVA